MTSLGKGLRAALLGLALALVCGPLLADGDSAVFEHRLDAAGVSALLGPSAAKVAAAQGMRGRFEQRKYLQDLPKPLLSSGEFLFARDSGVWWHTAAPFDSVFVLTREGISNRDEGGAGLKIRAEDQPGVAVAARIFFAMFALDFNTLAADFETYGMAAGDLHPAGWRLGLRPRSAALSAFFGEALIEGSDGLARRIVLRDAHGDRTEILLPDTSLMTSPLTQADRARFAN